MARTIDPAVQTLLETDLGQEIIIVLELFWTLRGSAPLDGFPPPAGSPERSWFADREISGVPEVQAKILNVSPVDAGVQILRGGQSKSVNVTLDDTDGTIKKIFDENDIHKAPVRVWFYVNGTDFATKKFPIFLGQINSPVVWNEGQRTFTFSIVNRIEDVEVGFSAEEGAFEHLAEDLIGKTWPLCFGTTQNVPALKASPAISGLLASGVGIKDFTLPNRIALAEAITCPSTPIGYKCAGLQGLASTLQCTIARETDQNCLQARCTEIERLKLELEEQSKFEFTRITIFGGEEFPQGVTVTLNINGALFTGKFDGTADEPSNEFIIRSRRHPDFDPSTGTVKSDPVEDLIESKCPGSPLDSEDSNFTDTIHGPVWTGLRNSRISWETYRRAPSSRFFWAEGGTTVTLQNFGEILYIANIVPSTILAVKARRFLNGNEFLLTVPDEFYEIRQTDYGGYQVMEIVFQRPLSVESQDTGGGWSDDIFISQESSVGPNTVDIIRWFIETYTDFAIDDASFNDVKAKIDVYRMDFPLLERPNIISILQNLARQARCALWQRDDTFFIKYLAEEPTPVATIGEDDILQNDSNRGTLQIELTSTLDLITKQTTTWQKDHVLPEPNKLILRHNIKRYGTHPDEQNFFTFAFLDLVRKAATFWLIRSANTWKRLRFSTSLEFTLLEPFDAVTLDLPDLASEPVLGVVERAVLDTANKQVDLEVWTPVRAGELTPYNFAFPAQISENALFPTIEAREAGDAGSGTEPNFSTIAPPGHPLEVPRTGVFSGFQLECNGDSSSTFVDGECRQDHGDRRPSDINDVKPEPDIPTDDGTEVSGSTSPISQGAGFGFSSFQRKTQDQLNKIEGDAGRAREVAEGGGTGTSPGSGDNDDEVEVPVDENFLDNLPDPDELPEDLCRYEVTVSGHQTNPPTGVSEEEATVCLPDPPTIGTEEIYVFDSLDAANSFCAALLGRPSCSGKPPCNKCIAACSIVQKGDCSEGDGDGNLIGFRGDASDSFALDS